jgi:hypothetical protein
VNLRRLLPVLILSALAGAQDLQVEATGYGPNVEAATRSAQRAAIEKGIGTIISSQTELENFQVKKDLVLSRTEGAVKSTETLKTSQGPDGAWEVTIRAVVSKSEIREDLLALSILRAAVGNPRVAILVRETVLGKQAVDGAVENQVIQGFRSREFEVVDPSDALRVKRSRDIQLAEGGDPKAAAILGAELGAEVVIVGTAEATETDISQNPYFHNTAMKSASGVVTLKAIDVNSKEILASSSADAPMVHVNPSIAGSQALEKAAKKALEKDGIIDQLLKVWQNKANNGQVLRVRVQNLPNFGSSQVVVEELRAEAVSVETRKLADRTLFLDVTWKGTASDFCSAIDGRKINKDRNKLLVVSLEGNSIVLEVRGLDGAGAK